MSYYRLVVSIKDPYNKNKLFDKNFFFKGDHSPLKEQVVACLEGLNKESITISGQEDTEILSVLEVLKKENNFPELEDGFSYSSIPYIHYKDREEYGHISIEKLKILTLE